MLSKFVQEIEILVDRKLKHAHGTWKERLLWKRMTALRGYHSTSGSQNV